MTSIDLLAGPRGRRFCLAVVTGLSNQLWSRQLRVGCAPHNADLRAEFSAAVASEATLAAVSRAPGEDLLTALSIAVDRAAYWQPPDDVDELGQTPEVLQALKPIAHALADRISGPWWVSPLDTGTQHAVQWVDEFDMPAPSLSGATEKVTGWRERTLASERVASRWSRSLKRRTGSSWWSTPAMSELVQTNRALPGLGSAGLLLVEDGAGWNRARVWPLAQTWRKTAYETTGLDATWLIPDYAAVARKYDSVHLTMAGYLATAGRPLDAGRGTTMLAGWDPDATYWLGDVLESSGGPTEWENPVVGTTAEWAPTTR